MNINTIGVIRQTIVGQLTQHEIKIGLVGTGIIINNTIISGGGSSLITKKAGESLGGHRIVRAYNEDKVLYASNSDLSQLHNILGLTTGAASIGSDVAVLVSGEIIEPSWNFTQDQYVYLGLNGQLTQTPPSSGFLLVVGTAIAPTVVFVKIGAPVQLN